MTHELKTINPYFEMVWENRKRFELRKNDRDFKEGDMLILKEYDPIKKIYGKRSVYCFISTILKEYEGLKEGYCILGIQGITCDYSR